MYSTPHSKASPLSFAKVRKRGAVIRGPSARADKRARKLWRCAGVP